MTYSQKFFNSANESNPEGELAVNILVGNIIEIATAHANMLGIGIRQWHILARVGCFRA